MESVSGTSLAASVREKLVIEIRPVRHERAEESRETERQQGVRRSRRGGHRAAHIFRQEVMMRFKMKFAASMESSRGPAEAYKSQESAEEVAAGLLSTARRITASDVEKAPATLTSIRDSVEEAATASRQVVETDDEAEAVKATEDLVKEGIDELEEQASTGKLRELEIESRVKQRSRIRIRTQEGDVVSFDLRRVDKMSLSDKSVETDGLAARETEFSASSNSRLVIRVKGELNEAEQEAVRSVFEAAERLANEFFSGDMAAALEIAAGLEIDSEQLARVSMRFRSVERISASESTAQFGPAQAAVADEPVAADTASRAAEPVASNPARRTAEPVASNTANRAAEPAASAISNRVAEPARAAPAPVERPASVSVDPVAAAPAEIAAEPVSVTAAEQVQGPLGGLGDGFGFGALLDYLGQLADYLEQQAAEFGDAMQVGSTGIRFEISQSFKLEILQSVMSVMAPEAAESEGENEAAGQVIQQLDDRALEVSV